jgi:hypothetical protein
MHHGISGAYCKVNGRSIPDISEDVAFSSNAKRYGFMSSFPEYLTCVLADKARPAGDEDTH